MAAAQGGTVRITGVVLDAVNAQPLPGVTVAIVGSGEPTVTELDGRYSLMVRPGEHQLKISLEGFQGKTIQITAEEGKPIELSTALTIGGFTEEVTVTADALTAESSTAAAQLLERRRASVISDNLGAPVAACASDARAPLSQTFESAEQAARAVLNGVAARNADALLDLAVDEREFRQIVWPELPSSRPEVGLPAEYAWGRLHLNSRSELSMTLAEHSGHRYDLVSVKFRGETTRYDTFSVHRETELVVRDASGATRTVQLFGSLLERNGEWKVFSYVVD